jgi:hypothetical protein
MALVTCSVTMGGETWEGPSTSEREVQEENKVTTEWRRLSSVANPLKGPCGMLFGGHPSYL